MPASSRRASNPSCQPSTAGAHLPRTDAVGTLERAIEATEVAEPTSERDRRDGSMRMARIDKLAARPFQAKILDVLRDRAALVLEELVEIARRDADRRGDLAWPQGRVREPLFDVVLDPRHQRPLHRPADDVAAVEGTAEQRGDQVARLGDHSLRVRSREQFGVAAEVQQKARDHAGEAYLPVQPPGGHVSSFALAEGNRTERKREHPHVPGVVEMPLEWA